ncbi:hypothetical protein, partial [Vibrio vulnificus]|uniref:hypothetical protein n=1 Tax=Vibrio vulnificus TaxID=672 RepID=UPI001A9231BB
KRSFSDGVIVFSPVTHHRHDGVTKEYDCWCLFVSAAERLRSTSFCPEVSCAVFWEYPNLP